MNDMSSLAKWERDLLIRRTREGVGHARAQGSVAEPKPKLDNGQAKVAKELIDGGSSVSCMARTFNVSRPTIYRAIERLDANA